MFTTTTARQSVVCSNTLAGMRHLTRITEVGGAGRGPVALSPPQQGWIYVQVGFKGPWLSESACKFQTNSLIVCLSTFLSQWPWPWIDLYFQNPIILQYTAEEILIASIYNLPTNLCSSSGTKPFVLQTSWVQTSEWQVRITFFISLLNWFHWSTTEPHLKATFPISLSSRSVTRDLKEALAAEARASACFQFACLFK